MSAGRVCTSTPGKVLKCLQPFKEAVSKSAGQMQSDRTARSMLFHFATMVDSRKGGVMVDRIDLLTDRAQVVEVKVDGVSSTVGQLSTKVDGLTTRVDGLTTTVGQLSTSFDGLTARVDGLTTTVGQLSTSFDGLTTRVDGLTTTVVQLSTRVDGLTTTTGHLTSTVNELATAMAAGFVEQREYTEFSHARLEAKMDVGFARVDRKLDQLIDARHSRSTRNRRKE